MVFIELFNSNSIFFSGFIWISNLRRVSTWCDGRPPHQQRDRPPKQEQRVNPHHGHLGHRRVGQPVQVSSTCCPWEESWPVWWRGLYTSLTGRTVCLLLGHSGTDVRIIKENWELLRKISFKCFFWEMWFKMSRISQKGSRGLSGVKRGQWVWGESPLQIMECFLSLFLNNSLYLHVWLSTQIVTEHFCRFSLSGRTRQSGQHVSVRWVLFVDRYSTVMF